MGYDLSMKEKVVEMYCGGTPLREIYERKGIPLSTIRSWTKDIVSAPLLMFKCAVCRKQKRTLNIQQIYCSESCKNRANYQRRRERQRETSVPDTHVCQQCGKRYNPTHSNAVKYCSESCRKSAARDQLAVRRDQSQTKSEKEQFNRCIETLLQARQDAMDMKLDRDKYRAELDTLEQFLANGSPTQLERDTIQEIFRSLKY